MAGSVKITVLVENTAGHGVLGEHGLAMWIDAPAGSALLDTGQGEVLLRNAAALGVRLGEARTIVLSHGHYDHTGGLAAAAEQARRATICLHPAAVAPKFARRADGTGREIGMPSPSRDAIAASASRTTWIEAPAEILPGLHATGPVPRLTDYEDTGGDFFLDAACTKRDPIADDQAVYFDTPGGVVVLLGCAHAGAVNSLMYVRELTGGRPIRAVIGGMHLLAAGEERLAATANALRRLDVRQVSLAHCTGFDAMAALYHELPGRCFHCAAGMRMEFDL